MHKTLNHYKIDPIHFNLRGHVATLAGSQACSMLGPDFKQLARAPSRICLA
jgi:hypothetical protein